MKLMPLIAACVATLTICTPADAAIFKIVLAAGANNSSIDQSGNGQTATANQTGSNDSSSIVQSSSGNKATVTQNGVVGGLSEVTQSGVNNTATLTQADDGKSVLPNGPANKSYVT